MARNSYRDRGAGRNRKVVKNIIILCACLVVVVMFLERGMLAGPPPSPSTPSNNHNDHNNHKPPPIDQSILDPPPFTPNDKDKLTGNNINFNNNNDHKNNNLPTSPSLVVGVGEEEDDSISSRSPSSSSEDDSLTSSEEKDNIGIKDENNEIKDHNGEKDNDGPFSPNQPSIEDPSRSSTSSLDPFASDPLSSHLPSTLDSSDTDKDSSPSSPLDPFPSDPPSTLDSSSDTQNKDSSSDIQNKDSSSDAPSLPDDRLSSSTSPVGQLDPFSSDAPLSSHLPTTSNSDTQNKDSSSSDTKNDDSSSDTKKDASSSDATNKDPFHSGPLSNTPSPHFPPKSNADTNMADPNLPFNSVPSSSTSEDSDSLSNSSSTPSSSSNSSSSNSSSSNSSSSNSSSSNSSSNKLGFEDTPYSDHFNDMVDDDGRPRNSESDEDELPRKSESDENGHPQKSESDDERPRNSESDEDGRTHYNKSDEENDTAQSTTGTSNALLDESSPATSSSSVVVTPPSPTIDPLVQNEKAKKKEKENAEKEYVERKVRQEYADEIAGVQSNITTHNSTSLELPRPLLFIHVPKTAGSTLAQVFKSNSPSKKYYHFWSHPRIDDLHIVPDKEVLFGHFRYGLHFYLPNQTASYATMLREPIERVISYYHFHLQDTQDPAHKLAKEHTFEEWLDLSPAAQNEMTKCLSGIRSEFMPSNESFEMAKHHLKQMGYVGLTERFDESLKLMKYYFGFKDLGYSQTKVGVKKPHNLDPAIREKIREKNLMDIELYKMAQEMFNKQMEDLSKHLLKQEMGAKL